jgi:capsular polysaccharide export protein
VPFLSNKNLSVFKNKRALFLQGPVGPFFKRFAVDLSENGCIVFKINFNAGDAFFFPQGHAFTSDISELQAYLATYIADNQIDVIVMFGDSRPIHLEAKEIAAQLSKDVYVFEEGYMRPNHITFEHMGVNGFSQLPKDIQSYLKLHTDQDIQPMSIINIGKTFWYAAFYAILYYVFANIKRWHFPHYEHHRPLGLSEGWPWALSTWRKQKYRFLERGIENKLTTKLRNSYYLVPLQVHIDSQISQHSRYASIEEFIIEVLQSFAKHAPNHTYLAIKQHPFDRGYKEYNPLIKRYGKELGISDRVFYIHDQYLPDLLKNSLGVVVINSTVGLSALDYLRPVKVCGDAIYNIEHITVQESLDQFWEIAQTYQPNPIYYHQYINYLTLHTQHNGSFYRRIKGHENATGVLWTGASSA